MGLTSAMNTAATGLKSNSVMLETIGDNIANVNTTAFKSNRADLESQFAITLRDAAGPANGLGGVNPSQVGLGSAIGAIQRSFVQGSISATGSPADLAIDGQGFFILNDGVTDFYTRDGAFSLDVNNQLVSRDGLPVQGWSAAADGTVDTTGAVGTLNIPLGSLTQVQATSTAEIAGNLNADATVATVGAVQISAALATAAGVASANTALTDLVDGNGQALFVEGDVIEINDVAKGGLTLPATAFVVGTDGGSVQDFMDFMEGSFAIHTDAGLNDGAGVTMNELGQIVVTSNVGEINAIDLDSTDIHNVTRQIAPFTFTATTEAAGSGLTTSFLVYDSLGNSVDVRLRLVLESKDSLGTTWRYYAESTGDSDLSKAVGSGTISFDQNGQYIGATGDPLSVNRAGTGAADPLTFALDTTAMTALASGSAISEFTLADQDGKPFGTLVDYQIDRDGLIVGSFSNGLTENLGQVALATFINPQGLKMVTDNNYITTQNSGAATVTAANTNSAGRIQSGALELSNVDLAREFIGLINASTGFSAASRVITAADQLLQELLLIAR
ncbi:MAG: hypothetical protein HJJLKODD_01832 [Phycisphaerae bacterium]|nr:hypothetical protein [Phycisphaerae bacterium]